MATLTNISSTGAGATVANNAAIVQGTPIKKLPPEILTKIMTHLELKDLAHCSAVNHKWQAIAGSDAVWKDHVMRGSAKETCQKNTADQKKFAEQAQQLQQQTVASAKRKTMAIYVVLSILLIAAAFAIGFLTLGVGFGIVFACVTLVLVLVIGGRVFKK